MEVKDEASSDSIHFDSILLVDLSGSMETKDINSEGIELFIKDIENRLDSDICRDFFSRIRDNEYIKRYEGAELGVLQYIIQREEYEDRISIIPFSNDAEAIEFVGENSFTCCSEDVNDITEKIITSLETHVRGGANIGAALKESIDVMKGLDKDKMKSITLLTDGIDDNDLEDIVDRRLSPREDVILNTFYLGDVSVKDISRYIAEQTRGVNRKISDLEELFETISCYSIPADSSQMLR